MGNKGKVEPIPFHKPAVGEAEIAAVVETLRSGWLTMGPKTQEFERQFAEFVGARFAVAVSSCTAELHLALDALGVGPGDEVLVPSLTFASTAAVVVHTGATPRLVDCEPDTLNLSPADAARRCGARTKAILPVHMAGHPCDMKAVRDIAAEHGLKVVEDAAHALPAAYGGRPIGSLSPATAFSFYATKNLTTGEGGMVTSNDADLVETMRRRRLHGMTRDAWRRYSPQGSWRYDICYPGFKYNMTDIAAAMGLVQLKRLAALQECRERLVQRYLSRFAGIEELELPVCRSEVTHAWHLFIVRVVPERLTITRDGLLQELKAAGIGTSVHFIPLHEHSYYRDVLGYRPEDFPSTSRVASRLVSLPLFPTMTCAEVDRVVGAVRTILRKNLR